jgi:hypothetical protein
VAIITEHEASETQREVARQRGLAWTARRPAATRKHERYIAVDTAPDYRTAPDAEKSVMIFDSEALQVAGKSVYDLESPPPVGATARFDTYSARYVGSGL